MFPSFPAGPPGLGLLLLRVVLGVGAILCGLQSGTLWIAIPAILASCFILAGFLTPFAAGLVGLGALGLSYFEHRWTPFPAFLIAAAVAMLGPGAFSIDSLLFGLREIVIPPVTRKSPDSGIKKP